MADGTLTRDERRRLRNAMAADPQLRRAVDDAVALRRELGHLARVPVPHALSRRLLGIANGLPHGPAQRVPSVAWSVGLAAAAAVAVAGVAFMLLRPAPEPQRKPVAARSDDRDEAVQQFEIAMAYLRRSATIASTEVTTAVGGGLRDALSASREKSRDQKQERRKNGG